MLRPDEHQTKTFSCDAGGDYGVKSSLKNGFQQNRSELTKTHPLQNSETDYDVRMKQIGLSALRNSQGIHAPLKIQMELNAVNKAVTRLPCLPSSNFAKDILNGNDDVIMPQELFGNVEDTEVMGDPHLMMEHKLGLKQL